MRPELFTITCQIRKDGHTRIWSDHIPGLRREGPVAAEVWRDLWQELRSLVLKKQDDEDAKRKRPNTLERDAITFGPDFEQ